MTNSVCFSFSTSPRVRRAMSVHCVKAKATMIERHVSQSPRGGKTHGPLDRNARIVVSSTPKFAKMVSHKYAEVAVHQCRSGLGTAICRRTGTLANGRPSVLPTTVPGFHPRRAG